MDNNIEIIDSIYLLEQLDLLGILDIRGNPVTQFDTFKLFVIFHSQDLRVSLNANPYLSVWLIRF